MSHQVKREYKPNFKIKRVRDVKYLQLIRLCPCIISKSTIDVEAAHVKYVDLGNYPTKYATGMASKPDDSWVLPLSKETHRTGPLAQHNADSEEEWWLDREIDPLALCEKLYNDGEYNLQDMLATIREHHKIWVPV
ncbi:MAG: hypothetical protein HRU29_01570 [Rhizobiales bacterium]|nr:hypothetical protein [Hyphomicrobiales bacterium]NRB13063.1 hypothetical protein [Hyphomicrobiales bacterium]